MKLFKYTIFVMIFVSIVIIYSYEETVNKKILFMENIEALSTENSFSSNEDCPGLKNHEETSFILLNKEVRRHQSDGRDMVGIKRIKRCSATGDRGTSEGNNLSMNCGVIWMSDLYECNCMCDKYMIQ